MASTSSSTLVSDEYCDCGYKMEDFARPFRTDRAPTYSTMGQPLIYYAQVQRQPVNRRQNSRETRKGRNCFVKAFRWYTQDHVTPQKKISPDISGFAAWMDTKYGEYLQDSQPHQPSPLQLKQMPTPAPEDDSAGCDASTTKKSKRVRSPWTKRKRASKNAGDVHKKPTESFEFIMRPKELPQHASECCHTTPTTLCKKSTATLLSSDPEGATKINVKPQNITKIRTEDNLINIKSEHVKATDKKSSEREAQTLMKIIGPDLRDSKVIGEPKGSGKEITKAIYKSKESGKVISCQCPEDGVVRADVETQYDPNLETAGQIKYIPCQANNNNQLKSPAKTNTRKKQVVLVTKPHKNVQLLNISCQCSKESIPKIDTHSQYQSEFGTWCDDDYGPCACNQEMRSTSAGIGFKETGYFVKKITYMEPRPHTAFMSSVAQTSDHSICLDKDPIHGYPLFLRICRADKLN